MGTDEIILSIDPSINNLGWSFVFEDHYSNDINQWQYGTIKLRNKEFNAKCAELQEKLDFAIEGLPVKQLVFEKPVFFNAERGHIAAKEGYTIDIGIIIGFIAGFWNVPFFFYTPQQWKGSVTKEITWKKMQRKFGSQPITIGEHEIDAVMLLYYHLFESIRVED